MSCEVTSRWPLNPPFWVKIKWAKNLGVTHATHKAYFEKFGKDFARAVQSLVDRNASKPYFADGLAKDDRNLVEELLIHYRLVKRNARGFQGRTELIEKVLKYIEGDETNAFVLYGESGCGKTSVIAKLADQVTRSLRRGEEPAVLTSPFRSCSTRCTTRRTTSSF